MDTLYFLEGIFNFFKIYIEKVNGKFFSVFSLKRFAACFHMRIYTEGYKDFLAPTSWHHHFDYILP